MDAERARAFLLKLPHVVKTVQWGDNLVFWTGDKAIGGKMFALINLDQANGRGGLGPLVISFAAGAERCAELCEREGLRPAPYFARIHWVAAERWDALRDPEWQDLLRAAHLGVLGKLPATVQAVLALPAKKRATLIAERRQALAAKSLAAKASAAKASAAKVMAAKALAAKALATKTER